MRAVINPALGGRGDFQKGLWIFSLAKTSETSEWLDSCEDLLVTLSSHNVSVGNPEGSGGLTSLVGSSELVY